ncbi:hypothetical protein ACQEVZ_55735 [Dactylosporangium sp. CA-152071]|uniref:hypothetical protein n=1 Tax=Dactylosporangium sp. CA-152071 TaxID=3239933 RepID=UPI003D8B79D1
MTTRQTEEPSQLVEWLTPFPFDGLQPTYVHSDDSRWQVTPHWAFVDGRAVLAGIDVRCFVEEYGRDGEPLPRRPVADGVVELTQQVLRSISLSAVRRESQAHLAARFADLADHAESWPPTHRGLADEARTRAAALTATGQPRKRRAPAQDGLLARVAQLYTEALAAGSTAPARYVEENLRQEGVEISTRGGRDQVRKWIQRARQRGLLRPA